MKKRLLVVVFLPLLILTLLINPADTQAHASYERSLPASNAQLDSGKPPNRVQVWFTENIEPRFSELNVVDKNGIRLDNNDSRLIAGSTKGLEVSLKAGLSDGAFTVIFSNLSADDGHGLKGSFAFLVGTGALPTNLATSSPLELALGSQNSTLSSLTPLAVGLKWLNYLGGTAVFGAIIFSLWVWLPTIRRVRKAGKVGAELTVAYARGITGARQVIWFGFGLLIIGWLGTTINQVITLGEGSFSLDNLPNYLFQTRSGMLWMQRLVLIFIGGVVFWLAVSGFNTVTGASRLVKPIMPQTNQPIEISSKTESSLDSPVNIEARRLLWWLASLISSLILLTTSLNSHAAAAANNKPLAIAADWLHLTGTSVWIGGLAAMSVGLSLAIPALVPGSGDRTRVLATLIPTFSQVAIISVMAIFVSGVINAAIQLGTVTDLFSTQYGITLSIKLGLLIPLMLLAAYNLLSVSPRMRAFARSKKLDPRDGAGSVAAGKLGKYFQRGVIAEIVIALLVLIAAAVLSQSIPPKNTTNGVVYQKNSQTDLTVELGIAPAKVGENTFEVRLTDTGGKTVSDASLVQLQLAMSEMSMGQPRLELKPSTDKPGRYLGQGALLSMNGSWNGTLLIQRNGKDDVRVPVKLTVK